MHLLIPFATSLDEAARHVLGDLRLPALTALLGRMTPTWRDEADESSLSPPHERALAHAWDWPAGDGTLPFAARAAAADGVAVGQQAWGLLTPVHWAVGREQVMLADPAALGLGDEESRALLETVRHLFESEGFTLAWGAATRWYAAHECLEGLPCAALDRAIGRPIEWWLRGPSQAHPAARQIARLQSEVQLLLYTHPINEAREERGALPVNSFWLSGCGRHRAAGDAAVQIDARLQVPLLAQDWAAWAEAWRALDAGPLSDLLAQAEAGRPVQLTLCGERGAQSYEAQPRKLLQRLQGLWRAPAPQAVLEAL